MFYGQARALKMYLYICGRSGGQMVTALESDPDLLYMWNQQSRFEPWLGQRVLFCFCYLMGTGKLSTTGQPSNGLTFQPRGQEDTPSCLML